MEGRAKGLYAGAEGPQEVSEGLSKAADAHVLYAGLRLPELINLAPTDINFRTGRIHVHGKDGYRTKTGRARTVEIHPRIEVHLRAALKKSAGEKYLFGGAARFNPKSVSRAIRLVIDGAGLDGIPPYSLRHTFITGLLRAGANIREVDGQGRAFQDYDDDAIPPRHSVEGFPGKKDKVQGLRKGP